MATFMCRHSRSIWARSIPNPQDHKPPQMQVKLKIFGFSLYLLIVRFSDLTLSDFFILCFEPKKDSFKFSGFPWNFLNWFIVWICFFCNLRERQSVLQNKSAWSKLEIPLKYCTDLIDSYPICFPWSLLDN